MYYCVGYKSRRLRRKQLKKWFTNYAQEIYDYNKRIPLTKGGRRQGETILEV
jgi:hypothetical protein